MIEKSELMRQLKVLILLRSLDQMAGGVERSAIQLANRLQAKGCAVDLLSLDTDEATAFYKINPEIFWNKLGSTTPSTVANFSEKFRRLQRIRKIVKTSGAQVIISFQGGATRQAILATFLTKCKVIAAERESLTKYTRNYSGVYKRYKHFFWLLFVSRIQVFFESYKSAYPFYLRGRTHVIPNFFGDELINMDYSPGGAASNFLFVGRFEVPKNPEIFITALKLSGKCGTLIGSGSLEQRMKSLLTGIDKIEILPPSSEVYKLIHGAQAVVNVSDWEGFPNVVLEAIAIGTPVIGFTGTAGVPDLISNMLNGILCVGKPNSKALAEVLSNFNPNQFNREKVSSTADPYRECLVLPIWLHLLSELSET
jgi:glycosyltransferase involved in cell wall biosynthesis